MDPFNVGVVDLDRVGDVTSQRQAMLDVHLLPSLARLFNAKRQVRKPRCGGHAESPRPATGPGHRWDVGSAQSKPGTFLAITRRVPSVRRPPDI